MTAVDPRIAWIEQNLVQASLLKGRPPGRATLADRMRQRYTPGLSVAVVDDYQLAWERGYGLTTRGGEPITTRTVFQACSISKPVTGLGVLRLVQAGVLELDRDVNDYLTSWKVPRNGDWQPVITLRQLLSHTAGTTQHGFLGYRPDEPVPTLIQVLNGEAPANSWPVVVNAVPGTRFRYSGGGTSIVQQVLEDVTGRDFTELMHELVFAPLGMMDSTYAQPLPKSWEGRAAHAHRADGTPFEGRWHIFPETGAVGLWTTAGDLARLVLAIQRSRAGQDQSFLAKALVDEMLTRQFGTHCGIGFALEGAGEALRFTHGGDNEGYKCWLVAHAEVGKAAVVLTNSDWGWAVYEDLLRTIAEVYEWPYHPEHEWPCNLAPLAVAAKPDPAAPGHAALVGTYVLGEGGLRFTVSTDGDSLMLCPAGQAPFALEPLGADRFFSTALDCEFHFARNDRGDVTALQIRQDGGTLTAERQAQ